MILNIFCEKLLLNQRNFDIIIARKIVDIHLPLPLIYGYFGKLTRAKI